jgi:hypothetical protein
MRGQSAVGPVKQLGLGIENMTLELAFFTRLSGPDHTAPDWALEQDLQSGKIHALLQVLFQLERHRRRPGFSMTGLR